MTPCRERRSDGATERPRGAGASAPRRGGAKGRRGTVLIAAMLVAFSLAGLVIVLCRSVRVEAMASANYAAAAQASAVERGAEQYLLSLLATEGPNVVTLPEEDFAAVPVGEGFFWVLRPDYGDVMLPAFGLTEESAKLNLNTATVEQLMCLPGMTDELANSIIDWRDEDDNMSAAGAENGYYLGLPDPYFCKNAPFETVEELLLVRGATRELLYGSGEAPVLGSNSPLQRAGSAMATDVALLYGIYDLLTVWSVEANTAADGTQRINITQQNQLTRLRQLLREKLGESRGDAIAQALGNTAPRDIFDLYLRTRMTADEFNQVADYLTSSGDQQVRGRINVNSAPRDVLLCLTQLDPADVDKLIGLRGTGTATDPTALAWVADALREKAVGLGNRITGRSSQYTADILAVSGNGRAFRRCRIVIDVQNASPQIVYRRDLTDRGWPMDPRILASLREGQGPGTWSGLLGSTSGGYAR